MECRALRCERLSRCVWIGFEVRLICVYHEFAQGARGLNVPSPRVSEIPEILKCDFGGPIEEKVSGLEGCRGFRGAFGLGSRCV